MTDYLSKGSTVTGAYYASELRKLLEALKSKRRGKLQHGVLLLHDNAGAHTSAVATSAAAECGYELLPHPPYSPDLTPSDFCLFPLPKEHLSGTHFQVTMTLLHLWRSFFRGKMNSSARLVYKSCCPETSFLLFTLVKSEWGHLQRGARYRWGLKSVVFYQYLTVSQKWCKIGT